MKILAPISSLKEVEKVINAGADEVYCGIIDKKLTEKYSLPFINRRPFDNCNLSSFNELKGVVDYCHKRNVQVYVTLNEPIYTEEEFNYIEYNLKKFCELGVDAVIVSDLGLVSYIKEKKYKINIHISTCASIYNAEGVQFCKKHGASRVILPRHMTIDEINGLIKKDSNIEYEVIVLNTNCQYDDGYCTYEHSLGNYIKDPSFEGGGCGAVEQMKVFLKKGHSSDLLLDIEGEYRRRQRTFNQSCGVCSIARLSKMGVDALKIVGREYVTEKKVKDVEFLYRVRKISETCNDESDLIKLVKSEYLKIYNKKCYDRCYY